MTLNKNQKKAVETIDENLLINAGAGTGKTRVLVDRYINILDKGSLKPGDEIESIVAITFTKKAAEEMKERIRSEIIAKFPEGQLWRDYYRDIEKANISTIHSFCSRILRENPIEAGIDPNFIILEDFQANKLKDRAIGKSLELYLNNPDFYQLLLKLRLVGPDELAGDFKSIYNSILTRGDSIEDLREEFLSSLESLEVSEELVDLLLEDLNILRQGLSSRAKIHRFFEGQAWQLLDSGNYSQEELISIVEEIEASLGTSKKYKETIDRLEESINKILVLRERENLVYYRLIFDILLEIERLYSQEKDKLSALDYDDLQIKSYQLLRDNRKILEDYQDRFRYIMIDEFQDTNELQKKIFYRLASEKEELDRGNLFVVGDPKQSIYGFRGADLDVYYGVRSHMEDLGKGQVIYLEDNYRTSERVMGFINHVFKGIMGQRYNSLRANIESDREVEVEILDRQDLEYPDSISEANYARYYEADLIAKRIRLLVDEEGYNYGDIALLFRASSRNYIYEEALKAYNIPYYNNSGGGYFERREVRDLLNAFYAIYNEEDQLRNLAFLRSDLIGLSDDIIFKLLDQSRPNLEGLKSIDMDLANYDKRRLERAIELYELFYRERYRLNKKEFLDLLLDQTLYRESLLLRDDGKQMVKNIDLFASYLQAYDEENLKEPRDFIDYLDELSERQEIQALVESEDSNVVSLMTIHKSKGLEFPVVILPELSSQGPNIISTINFHGDLGLGLKLEGRRAQYDLISTSLREKDQEEAERVLYVAMTRAEKLLILGCQGRDSGFKKMIGEFLNKEDYREIENIELDKPAKASLELIDLRGLEGKDDYPENFYQEELKPLGDRERTSISQYMDFLDCKRLFYFKHILGLRPDLFRPANQELEEDESDYLDPIVRGNLVHRFAEVYRSDQDPEQLAAYLFKEFEIENPRHKKQLELYFENYRASYSEDFDRILREEEFEIIINDLRIKAIIDRINIRGDRAQIIDYKTNRLRDIDRLREEYRIQLLFYTYLVEEILNLKVEKAGLLFLETGDYLEIEASEEDRAELYRQLEYFTEYIKNQDIASYEVCEKCNPYCQYKAICNRI